MCNQELLDEIRLLEKLNKIFEEILKNIYCSIERNSISEELTFKLHCIITNIHEVGMPTIKEICELYHDEWAEKD